MSENEPVRYASGGYIPPVTASPQREWSIVNASDVQPGDEYRKNAQWTLVTAVAHNESTHYAELHLEYETERRSFPALAKLMVRTVADQERAAKAQRARRAEVSRLAALELARPWWTRPLDWFGF